MLTEVIICYFLVGGGGWGGIYGAISTSTGVSFLPLNKGLFLFNKSVSCFGVTWVYRALFLGSGVAIVDILPPTPQKKHMNRKLFWFLGTNLLKRLLTILLLFGD